MHFRSGSISEKNIGTLSYIMNCFAHWSDYAFHIISTFMLLDIFLSLTSQTHKIGGNPIYKISLVPKKEKLVLSTLFKLES